ncbi:MAG: hypothetical protein AAFZ58_00790 [Pseudomonadota bacterium]
MTTITLHDLPCNEELDREAADAVIGGFLGGLIPHQDPVSSYLPTINNFFVQYEQNIFQQNPTNISIFNGDTGGDIINNISTNSLTAASPMSFTRISGGLPG